MLSMLGGVYEFNGIDISYVSGIYLVSEIERAVIVVRIKGNSTGTICKANNYLRKSSCIKFHKALSKVYNQLCFNAQFLY